MHAGSEFFRKPGGNWSPRSVRNWSSDLLSARCHRPRCRPASPRANLDQTQRDQVWKNMPIAPPPRGPGPPPIPPPAPPPAGESFQRVALATITGIAIALAWNFNISGQAPTVMEVNAQYPDGRPAKVYVVKTKGGNLLRVSQDEKGRLFFVDMQGNLYYDSGIKEIGFYFVGRDNEVFNFGIGPSGESVRTYVGNMADLVTARVDDVGGIPVTELSQAFRQGKGKAVDLTMFYDPSVNYELPENAPVFKRKDGSLQGPPELDEGAMMFEKLTTWLPFSDNSSDNDVFKSPYRRGTP
eukprot:jgi/Botrbrau1/16724/Bobra.0276s0004.1